MAFGWIGSGLIFGFGVVRGVRVCGAFKVWGKRLLDAAVEEEGQREKELRSQAPEQRRRRPVSEETKERIRAAALAVWAARTGDARRRKSRGAMPEQTKEKIAAARRGTTHSEETRRRIAESMRGRKLSHEHRRKISERMKGEGNPRFRRREEESASEVVRPARKSVSRQKVPAKAQQRMRKIFTDLPGGSKKNVVDSRDEHDLYMAKLARRIDLQSESNAVLRDRLDSKAKQRAEISRTSRVSCRLCGGSGFGPCNGCGARQGVVGTQCFKCFGSGIMTCSSCEGVGSHPLYSDEHSSSNKEVDQ
uniref:Nuclease associated modular domain-containing protein n=1 Tax=Compsopogon caeruleus TaxID=31354 RepID=A0A7S1TEK1_9RHOD|mmetsp:Transcript_2394/g.4143  ORF Transcript_2394/g.4143 Transcript_2394/m.4143 type:complete len:306 (+) Transcript_2394:53-970(+)